MLLVPALLGLAAFSAKNATVLTGKITDDSGEILIGATVKILTDTGMVKGVITDFAGVYRVELEPGTYDVEFAYTGYETQRITGVQVLAQKITTLNASLNSGAVLEEVVVTSYKRPLIKMDETSSGMTLTSEEIRASPAPTSRPAGKKEKARSAAKPAAAGKDLSIRGARDKRSDYYLDGIPVSGEAPAAPAEMKSITYDRETVETDDALRREPMPGAPTQPTPRAGLLTAGEWNDLHNWNKHWVDLLADGETDAYQKQYRFFPKNRYSVLIQNEQNLPVSDAAVHLLDKSGKTVWEARTDNMGRAELWANLYEAKEAGAGYKVVAFVDGKKLEIGAAKPVSEGLNMHKVQRECKHANKLDIVWAVDATGSMGDELEYLKTELLDVIGRVKNNNPELGVRMGSVFYRDEGDDYIVKSSALNHDIAKTVDYIRRQSAGGGGDYPEAVHSALEEAIFRQPWSREAVARICFLVLDARPHQKPEVIESLQKSIREAAKKRHPHRAGKRQRHPERHRVFDEIFRPGNQRQLRFSDRPFRHRRQTPGADHRRVQGGIAQRPACAPNH